MGREIKISQDWGKMNQAYLPVLKEYDYREETSTIYLRHIDDIFDLQEKLKSLSLNTTFEPSIIIDEDCLWIYDDYVE